MKIKFFSPVIKLDFLPLTNSLPATLASKVLFAFRTQSFSLQQDYYFQYKDESSSIFGVASPLSTSITPKWIKRFSKVNPRQTSSLSLFPKCSKWISIDN